MELYRTSRLRRSAVRSAACRRYIERLPLVAERRRELLIHAANGAHGNTRETMAELHRMLSGRSVESTNAAYASVRARLELYCGVPQTKAGPVVSRDVHGHVRLVTTPPLNRTSMAPKPWPLKLTFWPFAQLRNHFIGYRGRFMSRKRGEADIPPTVPDLRGHWHRAASVRRFILLSLVLMQTVLATSSMTAVLPYHGRQPLEIAILTLFAILFGWISAGFWTATLGFLLLLLFGRDRYAISASAAGDVPIYDDARTAIVMPICNENIARVFAGLRATYDSLSRTGELRHFDFFILSDSSDPDICGGETKAWLDMCRAAKGFGRVFYRWRKCRVNRKSGNVADFCRRWGSNYRYMVVMDADSVMSGECLTTLVRLMEANPNAGIIQTCPRASGRDTLYARIQQFANSVYGPLFTAGMHFWQLGESHYWGHNAILRVAPFIRHCALGRLPGRGTLSGEILSHDFVEAALMRRAGWGVWLAYDLPGSYEEMPPNLVDELKRDRRWCQGNLINSRLFLAEGLHAAHRAVFATGVMAYLSALLWFLFLLLSTALLAIHTLVPPKYFTQPNQLFPLWPEWHIEWAVALFTATATMLFLPKILSIILIMTKGAQRFGGRLRLAASMTGEIFFSALLAPIRMLFHTQFIVTSLIGWQVQWKSPPREDTETTWGEALQRHGWHTLIGSVWTGTVYWLNPAYLWWLAPVVGALMLSIPISVYSSRVALGQHLRAARMFLIPEESTPPQELRATWREVKRAVAVPDFVAAVVDPIANALACASDGVRIKQSRLIRNARVRLARHALKHGPDALTAREKITLLSDPLVLSQLHFEVWAAPEAHPRWREAQIPKHHTHNVIVFPAGIGSPQPRSAPMPR